MVEKSVNVKVVLHAPGSNPPFHFESSDVPIDSNNVIYFSNCGKFKGFLISYDLDDTNNPGYRFPTKADSGNDYLNQALWASETGPCPTQACTWDGVFKARSVDNGGLTLVVWNKNEVVQDFAYTLRVRKSGTWLDLDPGGSNKNGGFSSFSSVATGVVTGAAVGVGTVATISNSFDASAGLLYGVGGAVVGLIVGFLFDRM